MNFPLVDSGSISKKDLDDVKKRLYQSPPDAIKEDPEDMEIDYAGFEMMKRGGTLNGLVVRDTLKKSKR